MNAKTITIILVSLVAGLVLGMLYPGSEDSGPPTVEEGGERVVKVKWKMASVFPATLEVLGDGGVVFSEQVSQATGGRVNIKFFDPHKLVPPLEIFDAVSKGAVDAGWSAAGFWIGKLPAAPLFTSVPFGPDSTEYLAWMFEGGGVELYRELYSQHNIHVEPCTIIPPEAAGWFREPITSFSQFKGMKIRFFGLGGKVMQKIGASVQLLAPGDIYPALERGVLDATEFSMPNTDLSFGFHKIAKHYYFPGWHQQSSIGEFIVNMDRWNAISGQDKLIISMACKTSIVRSISQGESLQGAALEEIKAQGVTIHYWDQAMLDQFEVATAEVMAEEAAKDPFFARAWNSLQKFRAGFKEWARLSRLPKKVGR